MGSAYLLACGGDPNALTGGPGTGANPDDPNAAPGALECSAKPEGRAYILFDGSRLEGKRTNENVGVNRARVKPFGVLKGEYQRVLGLVPPSLGASASSFDEPPPRWFAEAEQSGVSLNAAFSLSFEGCSAYAKTRADMAEAPTSVTASAVCTSLMRKAWSKTPSVAEVDACVMLATTKLASEPDPQRQWSYVCASVLSSSPFLTF